MKTKRTTSWLMGFFIAILLSITGCGGGGGNGGSSGNDSVEIKTGLTDSNGQTTFNDKTTQEEVILEVIDSDDGTPVQNMNVTYYDGDGYEVFLVSDPQDEYFPYIGIYPHNSKHIIEIAKFENGIYEIYTIDEDNFLGSVVWSWKSENKQGFQTYYYDDTVDYDEYIEIQERGKVIIDILYKVIETFGYGILPKKPSEIFEDLFPEEENPPQRWDIYWYRDGYDEYSRFTMIPSNIPTVRIETLDIDGDEVYISWEGTDKDTYDEAIFMPDNKDLTKYLDGNDTSDLVYSWRVTQSGAPYIDWSEFDTDTSIAINIPDCGTYTFELRAQDEVDNIGAAALDFDISEGCQEVFSDLEIKDVQACYYYLNYLYACIDVTVVNSGNADSPAYSIGGKWSFSCVDPGFPSTWTFEKADPDGIKAKEEETLSLCKSYPYNWCPPIGLTSVKVDSKNEVVESDETNNTGGSFQMGQCQ